MFVHTGTHTHSQVGVTRGNVKNSLGKQLSLNTVERPACPVAARGGGYSAISVESAQSDSIEVAYDISSMRMMTVHKASTNQKHGPSASLKNESLKFYFWYFDHDNDSIYWLCYDKNICNYNTNNPLVPKKCTLSPKIAAISRRVKKSFVDLYEEQVYQNT